MVHKYDVDGRYLASFDTFVPADLELHPDNTPSAISIRDRDVYVGFTMQRRVQHFRYAR